MLRRASSRPRQPPPPLPDSLPPPPLPKITQLAPPLTPTPLYAQFATSTSAPAPLPTLVPSLPGSKHSSTPAFPTSTLEPRLPLPTSYTAAAGMPPAPPAVADDGPLFRATLAALEKRAASLRLSLKKLHRSLEASLSALQANAAAQESVDEALEELSLGSLTSQSEALGGLYDRELRERREEERRREQSEISRGREMGERVRGAIERLKTVEERKKVFDGESKRYYDELAKYLSKSETDTVKAASQDAKQAERLASFRQQRSEYSAFLEGLVESEEGAVAQWLRSWANIDVEELQARERERKDSLARLEGTKPLEVAEGGKGRVSAGSSKDGWIHVNGEPWIGDNHALPPPTLDRTPTLDSMNPPTEGSTPYPKAEPVPLASPPPPRPSSPPIDIRRRRRSSIPHFHLPTGVSGAEPASSTKRDGLKRFLKTAQNSIQSALPSSASSPSLAADLLARRPSPPPPMTSSQTARPPSPARTRSSPPLGQQTQSFPRPPLPPSTSSSASQLLRRREGFLFATDAGQKHTTTGDGGARWSRYWIVLSEGQLIEYDKWSDVMSVHGQPINLRYATARMSRNSERRFTFEVLTPTLRRVFQASGEEECKEWVAAISKSVESLLNGTSSVRHFDSSALRGSSPGYSFDEFGSSLSLARPSQSSQSPEPPTSPSSKSRLSDFNFLSRRASLGHGRKPSASALTSKKDKRRSHQSPPVSHSIPYLTIGEEDGGGGHDTGAPVDRAFFDASSRRGHLAFSEGSVADRGRNDSRPSLHGLGIPFPAFGSSVAASRSSPDLLVPLTSTHGHRSTSSPFPDHTGPSSSSSSTLERDDAASTSENGESSSALSLAAQDRAISDAVRGWASSNGGGDEGGSGRSGVSEAQAAKYRNARRIAEIATRGGVEWENDQCADCREGGPKWASWSLGVTLCIRCSGVHRSLGTHVSRVRAVELDDWSDEQLAQMEAVGNARSNAFYEARLPPGFVEDLSDSTVAAFIREKYIDKRWAALDISPPSTSTISSSPSLPRPSDISLGTALAL